MTTPYADTSVPASRSRGDIDDLLKKMGAIAIQWTETPASIQGKECPILQFAISCILNGVEQKFVVRLQAPFLEITKGRGHDKKIMPNMNASMRLLFWYVKSKAEAIEYGLEDFIEAFMPRILVSLPDGRSTTMSEVVKGSPKVLSQVFQITDMRVEK